MIQTWLRVVRPPFLLSSIIAVSLGLSISYWGTGEILLFESLLIYAGVVALHASVDLLNDYWDFKRGIDTQTKRTGFSGGTGVLPEGLLKPDRVYQFGILFLFIGAGIGLFFVIYSGMLVAVFLAFAVVSIYFYSTRIVDVGLGEVFVAIKGSMIVLGTYYIQTGLVSEAAILGGLFTGILSSMVLFTTSFPDYEADKSKGRKTLVITLGKSKAAKMAFVFPFSAYVAVLIGIWFGLLPFACLITLSTIPLFVVVYTSLLRNHSQKDTQKLVPLMKQGILYSRTTGVIMILAFLIEVIM